MVNSENMAMTKSGKEIEKKSSGRKHQYMA